MTNSQEHITTELKKSLEEMIILRSKILTNLIFFIIGIIAAKSVTLSNIAMKLKDVFSKGTETRKIKRIYRWNISMNNLEYIHNGDYFIPNLTLSEQPQTPIGKHGRMRKTYLQEQHPAQYNHLLLSEKLYPHLLEADQTANERLVQLTPQMAKAAGITEQLKNTDQMRWVALMNTVKVQVEEIIWTELIYS